jgi:rhodanese-related sulfurtransferase
VRPEAEFRAGHIAGARSAPLPALDELASTLTKRREVVAYCRGPYCVYADAAVRELSRRGFRARRLVDGFPEWRRAGLPIVAGADGYRAKSGATARS